MSQKSLTQNAPRAVVAAESVYGDIAQAVGGDRVTVRSILTQPGADPHFFEATASVARALASWACA